MTKGTGTYDDPIIVDSIFSKTIDGVKKFFKINTGGSTSSDTGTSNGIQYDSTGAVTLKTKPQYIRKSTDDSNLVLCGGNSNTDGGFVIVHGSKEKTKTGCVELISQSGTQSVSLTMWSSQYSLPYITIKNDSKTQQKGIVFSVNNKIATNGNVDVYPVPNTGASPTGMLQNQTNASKKITQSGVIYVNITSAESKADSAVSKANNAVTGVTSDGNATVTVTKADGTSSNFTINNVAHATSADSATNADHATVADKLASGSILRIPNYAKGTSFINIPNSTTGTFTGTADKDGFVTVDGGVGIKVSNMLTYREVSAEIKVGDAHLAATSGNGNGSFWADMQFSFFVKKGDVVSIKLTDSGDSFNANMTVLIFPFE